MKSLPLLLPIALFFGFNTHAQKNGAADIDFFQMSLKYFVQLEVETGSLIKKEIGRLHVRTPITL